MEDTWTSRDLPVLDATVALLEEGIDVLEVADIAGRSGLSVEDVARAVRALDGEYVGLRMSMGGPASWFIQEVTPAARRAAGQWPTAENLIAQLAAGLGAAAEREADPEQKGRLRQAAGLLGGGVRDIAVEIAARLIERGTGLG